MKMHRIRTTPAARDDLDAIVDYLRERDPSAALNFVDAARETFVHIAHAPAAYAPADLIVPGLAELRWRPIVGAFRKYIVFYRADASHVDVVRVLHCARNLRQVLADDD